MGKGVCNLNSNLIYPLVYCPTYFNIVFFIHNISVWLSCVFFFFYVGNILSQPSNMCIMQIKVLGSSIIILLSVGICISGLLFSLGMVGSLECYVILFCGWTPFMSAPRGSVSRGEGTSGWWPPSRENRASRSLDRSSLALRVWRRERGERSDLLVPPCTHRAVLLRFYSWWFKWGSRGCPPRSHLCTVRGEPLPGDSLQLLPWNAAGLPFLLASALRGLCCVHNDLKLDLGYSRT